MVHKLNVWKDEHVPSSSSDSSTSEDAAPSVTPAGAGPLDLLFCSLLTVLRRAVNSDRTVQHGLQVAVTAEPSTPEQDITAMRQDTQITLLVLCVEFDQFGFFRIQKAYKLCPNIM